MNAVKEKAPAKINLFLDVVAKRADGFHDIRTVMHSVSLCDEITARVGRGKGGSVRLTLLGNRRLPTDSKNLAALAAERFLHSAGISDNVEITLNKRIPVAAGLAGGSSDAAAVLRALNRLYKRPFTDRRLLALAAELGSDVPYCLVGGTALCEGRGELITRLPSPKSFFAVIATAHERVSTPAAYAELDELFPSFDGANTAELEQLLTAIREGTELSGFYNIFEAAVLPACPGAAALRSRLIELGASRSLMSGSGPSVYGIFDTEEAADRSAESLTAEGYTAFATRG
ncbi:MAG: 4-(cytidine 5'-diphospho)-2-C-methyl-D-erythritol kinase [Clostridia bacterium]|nr:4-(cytidine 5'-diphospho)-2-C-methyl-D-erythritol kinase [Clostridia bacterium]